MKYDVFMRTRTSDRDYEWFNRPNYMPMGVFNVCRSIAGLCENNSFDGLSQADWYSNFFYLRIEGCCILLRVARTHYTASDGQSITSFEGVTVRDEYEKQLFYNIPALINELSAKSFRERLEEEGAVPDVLEFETKFNPFDATVPDGIKLNIEHNSAYDNLLKFTAFTDKFTGYMFGKNAKDFSLAVDKAKLGLKYVFDFNSGDDAGVNANSFTESYRPICCEYNAPVATGTDKVAINILVQETGESSYRYRWEIKPWDNSVKDSARLRYVTQFFNVEDRIELARLELQKESIKKFLLDTGWEKQPIGLRFDKNTYQREGS
jgi:hypothetical protein